MLAIFIDALKRHGPSDALFLDNGPTYVGDTLATACKRLGIVLVHAKPHDPRARGKMERFWRTLREGLLDHCTGEMTLDMLNERLAAFLERYHDTPHAGLFGRTPRSVFRAHVRNDDLTDDKLREALTVRENRRVSPTTCSRSTAPTGSSAKASSRASASPSCAPGTSRRRRPQSKSRDGGCPSCPSTRSETASEGAHPAARPRRSPDPRRTSTLRRRSYAPRRRTAVHRERRQLRRPLRARRGALRQGDR
ncbi:MAG: transposase [Polyangiaceae bacterium]|nr:transposase [Polyangiaceae bacterium]